MIFLGNILAHLACYRLAYPSQKLTVSKITAKLEEEAAEWVATIHDEGAPELRDAGRFLGELKMKFENEAKVQQAEGR